MNKLFDIKISENPKNDKVLFKEYNMDKMMLPANFGQLIPNDHIVRKVNSILKMCLKLLKKLITKKKEVNLEFYF